MQFVLRLFDLCARLSFREVSCAFANASIQGVFGYMMFIARLCTSSISLWRPNVSEVDHAGHAYFRVCRTAIIYTIRRSSTGMPDRLSCSSRNSLLSACHVISSICTYHVRLLVMVMPSIFASVTQKTSYCHITEDTISMTDLRSVLWCVLTVNSLWNKISLC